MTKSLERPRLAIPPSKLWNLSSDWRGCANLNIGEEAYVIVCSCALSKSKENECRTEIIKVTVIFAIFHRGKIWLKPENGEQFLLTPARCDHFFEQYEKEQAIQSES